MEKHIERGDFVVTAENIKENRANTDLEDVLLIEKIRNGENEHLECLINKYKHFVRSKTKKYFLVGGDKEDVFQEGMIGLFKAIRDYRIGNMRSFFSFVDLCVNRQLITAIKTSTRKKHSPLNSYTSLDKPMYEEEGSVKLIDILPGTSTKDLSTLIVDKETKDEFENKLTKLLSDLEKKVLTLYLEGLSYGEISEKLQTQMKSIDNALTRVKSKIEKHFFEKHSR